MLICDEPVLSISAVHSVLKTSSSIVCNVGLKFTFSSKSYEVRKLLPGVKYVDTKNTVKTYFEMQT